MKQLFLFYITILFSWQAQAQSIDKRPVALQKHKELTSARLSEAQVQAYQKRAKQKLGDMVDYMQIVLQSKQATEQKLALKQLQKLFWQAPAWTNSAQSLRAYLGNITSLSLKAVKITQLLTPTDRGEYKGKLTYQIAYKKETLDFTVRKYIKSIGSREVVVWKLFF
ncbi:hypothetical protein BKI52_22605 [marine bacterium AO1-C]|nr:hypothetical protein BKI52_22605 [marine bacterium AO1-C]